MSVFTGDNQAPATEENQDFVQQLVASKGEQWADPQTLAKGKLEADKFIEDLKLQVQNLEAQVNKQDYAQELLAKLEEGKAPQPNVGQEPENTTPKFNEEQIESLIRSQLAESQKQQIVQSNLQKADEMLTEAFGTEAGATVEKRSKELGLTKERLREIAADSPEGFMSLMGAAPVKEQSPTVPAGRLNTTADTFSSSSERTWKYYNALRKENPREYRKPAIQKAMMEDRNRLGDKFYN